MKKKTLFIAILICLITIISITAAYLVVQSKTDSVIAFGNAKIELIETTIKDGNEIPVNTDSIDITNTTSLSRIARVKSRSTTPVYVRISISVVGKDKNNKVISDNSLITIAPNNNWIYKNGFYYYKEPLLPDNTTTELMDTVNFNNSMITRNYQGGKLKLNIKAQAVQSKHNSNNVLDAKGWPK